MGFNLTGISWNFEKLESQEFHGNQIFDTSLDFSSKKEAAEYIDKHLELMTCRACGGNRISASGIRLCIRKVHFYTQKKRAGLFGREKVVDELVQSKWRIESSYLEDGKIRCKSCKMEHYRFPTKNFVSMPLASASDLLQLLDDMDSVDAREFIQNEIRRENDRNRLKIQRLASLSKESNQGIYNMIASDKSRNNLTPCNACAYHDDSRIDKSRGDY